MAENTSFLIPFVLTLLILNQGSATVSKAAASFSPAAHRRLTMRSRSFPPNSDSAILLLRHSHPKPYSASLSSPLLSRRCGFLEAAADFALPALQTVHCQESKSFI